MGRRRQGLAEYACRFGLHAGGFRRAHPIDASDAGADDSEVEEDKTIQNRAVPVIPYREVQP
jgi:hypothetical protein